MKPCEKSNLKHRHPNEGIEEQIEREIHEFDTPKNNENENSVSGTNSEDQDNSLENASPHIGSLKDTPEWLRDDYLINGYRINHRRISDLLRSLFRLHNETFNIWTHLIGVIVFLSLTVYLIWSPDMVENIPGSSYATVPLGKLREGFIHFLSHD